MSILLTGGCGYIGSHTAVALIEAGFDVILADDFRNCARDVPDRIETITGKRPKTYEADICNFTDVDRIFVKNSIDGVIHFAGLKAVGESVEKPLEYYRDNLDSTITLLEAMIKYGCGSIVFSSSATVYASSTDIPYTEASLVSDATNPYGRSKIMNERIIEDAAGAYGLSAVLLRYFNPVGAHPCGLIGEQPSGIPNNLMPYITQVAAGKLPILRIFGGDYPTPDGTGVRDYIHVCDLASGHVKALKYAHEHKGTAAFNLGTGMGVSVLQLTAAFENATGISIPYEIVFRRPGDLPEYYSDPSLAERELGWKAEKSLEDMCRDAWSFQKNNI